MRKEARKKQKQKKTGKAEKRGKEAQKRDISFIILKKVKQICFNFKPKITKN